MALNVGTGRRSDSGNAPTVAVAKMVTFNVGEDRKPVFKYGGLLVAFTKGRGRRPEAAVFNIGAGKRPDTDAFELVVKFKVGSGERPDLGRVELAV